MTLAKCVHKVKLMLVLLFYTDLQCLIRTKVNAKWRTTISGTWLIAVLICNNIVVLRSVISTTYEVSDNVVYVPGAIRMVIIIVNKCHSNRNNISDTALTNCCRSPVVHLHAQCLHNCNLLRHGLGVPRTGG